MGVYWNNNGKNGNSTIDIEDSFIISYVKKWIYSKGDTLMNADVEFLNYVYQNSQMGIDTLEQLLEITEDEKLQTCLEKQIEGYRKFHNEARDILNRNGYDEKGLGTFEKIRTYLMVNLQTMADDSTSHIAKMLIQGSSMGITEAVKKLHQYENDVEKDIKKLMERLQEFEEENVEGISVGNKAAGEMLPDEECIYPPPVLRKDIMKLQLFIEKISLRILSYIVV